MRQYDAIGNRTVHGINGTTESQGIAATSNRLISTGAQVLGYDANGNLTTVDGVAQYRYDAFNRMDSAVGATYYVNPEGQRLRKVGALGTTFFAPDRGGPILAENANGGWVDYVWVNGRLLGRVAGGQLFAIHTDQVGRPESVTNASKSIVWSANNFAFDRQVVMEGFKFNLGFPGQYFDDETKTWNNGFRDYRADLGRYIQSDPVGMLGGSNSYAYVDNAPLSTVDSLGLKPGDPFSSAHAAAYDVLTYINSVSIAVNREYGGLVYRKGGRYYATKPKKGCPDSVNSFVAGREAMPVNAVPVGDYHTHANYSVAETSTVTMKEKSSYDDDHFSDKDMANSARAAGLFGGWQSYLGTPGGGFYFYDAHDGEQRALTP